VESCIFCRISKGDAPASVVYEDANVVAFLDTNPVQRGHVLVIPKKHFVDIWDIDSEVFANVVSVTKRVAHRLREVLNAEGINIFSASGKPAGQDIYHFHMHVIPLGRGERTKFREWWLSALRSATNSIVEQKSAKSTPKLHRVDGAEPKARILCFGDLSFPRGLSFRCLEPRTIFCNRQL